MTVLDQVELATLKLKIESLTGDNVELSRKVDVMGDQIRGLQREQEKWLNRGIGVGLAISMLGGLGGYLIAKLKEKTGFP